jgi:hypothetical protein
MPEESSSNITPLVGCFKKGLLIVMEIKTMKP